MVPAHSLLAPALAWVIAAARVMPDVCGVFKSSSSECTILTPWVSQSIVSLGMSKCTFVAAQLKRVNEEAIRCCQIYSHCRTVDSLWRSGDANSQVGQAFPAQ